MHVAIAIHHPKPEHVQDFLDFMATVEAAMEGTPGLLSVESWRELGGGRLVGMSRWESQEAFTAALRESGGTPLAPVARADYDRRLAALRRTLDEATFADAWAAGGAATLEELIAELAFDPLGTLGEATGG